MSYLADLNPKQKEAVESTEGPLLIIAGAGAGKTKTLTYRILHLIKNGVTPKNILAITFTNKAAKEMRERVEKLLAEDKELNRPISSTDKPFVSTFHSLGVQILKEQARELGISRYFGIFDRGDSIRAVKEAMKTVGVDPKTFEPGKLLSIISNEKGKMVTASDYTSRQHSSPVAKLVSAVWNEYEKILKTEKAFDFDDLLLKTALLLKNKPEIRAYYQNVWHYLHIDEYQDTNRVQYEIARQITGERRNICVVGDVDQNIYSWRGADIKNILDFEKDYPKAKIVLLEQNYRSTQTILTVANRIIAKNTERVEKNLFTKNGEGEKVSLLSAYDEADEARFVSLKSQELIKNGVSPKEIAVLYRANFQSRALEEAFLREEVPYQVLGTRFFERKEVKDAISYLKAALNPENLSDLKRIINVPARGIGKVTLIKLFAGQEKTLPLGMQQKIAGFKNLLAKIKVAAEKEKLSQAIKFIIKETGLENLLKLGTDEDRERLENLRELVTFATKYDILPQAEGLDKFLSDVALATDQDELMREHEAVKLMTVHAAKGLEFEYVFITGLEEDLFPHQKLGGGEISKSEAEEERRLFYVALTRAKKKLYLTYTSLRTIFGEKRANVPSEFIFDIDEEFIESEESLTTGSKIIYLD